MLDLLVCKVNYLAVFGSKNLRGKCLRRVNRKNAEGIGGGEDIQHRSIAVGSAKAYLASAALDNANQVFPGPRGKYLLTPSEAYYYGWALQNNALDLVGGHSTKEKAVFK